MHDHADVLAVPEIAWTAFATILSAAIARRNSQHCPRAYRGRGRLPSLFGMQELHAGGAIRLSGWR